MTTQKRLLRRVSTVAGMAAIAAMVTFTASCAKEEEKAPETTTTTTTTTTAPTRRHRLSRPRRLPVSSPAPNPFSPSVIAPPAPTATLAAIAETRRRLSALIAAAALIATRHQRRLRAATTRRDHRSLRVTAGEFQRPGAVAFGRRATDRHARRPDAAQALTQWAGDAGLWVRAAPRRWLGDRRGCRRGHGAGVRRACPRLPWPQGPGVLRVPAAAVDTVTAAWSRVGLGRINGLHAAPHGESRVPAARRAGRAD